MLMSATPSSTLVYLSQGIRHLNYTKHLFIRVFIQTPLPFLLLLALILSEL